MSKVAGSKRKLKTITITEKYKILKEVDKVEPSAFISKKYGIAKQWVVKRKNKNLFGSREKQNFCEKSLDASLRS